MKRWLRYACIAGVFLGIAFGIVWESSTHVARGWIRGEATFNGRPTSYWRARVDYWLTQFVEPEDAVRCVININGVDAVDGVVIMRPAPHPVGGRLRAMFQSAEDREREWDTPEVFIGNPDSAAVLQELARDEKYRLLAENALHWIAIPMDGRQP